MAFEDALRGVLGVIGQTFAPESAARLRQQQMEQQQQLEQKRRFDLGNLYQGIESGAISPEQGNQAIQQLGGTPVTGPSLMTQERAQTLEMNRQSIEKQRQMQSELAPILNNPNLSSQQKREQSAPIIAKYDPTAGLGMMKDKEPTQLIQDAQGNWMQVTRTPGGSPVVSPVGVRGMVKPGAGPTQDLTKDPETLRSMAVQAWSGDSSVFQNIGRGNQGANNIIALRKEIQKYGKEQGFTDEEIGRRISAANAQYQGYKAQERSMGTRAAQIQMAASEANQMSNLVIQNMEKVAPGEFVPANQAINYFNTKTGDPKIRSYGAALNSFINAYSRAINPSGSPTVHDKEHARELLSTADSPEAVKAVIATLQQEMQAALTAPEETRQQLMESMTRSKKETKKVVKFSDL